MPRNDHPEFTQAAVAARNRALRVLCDRIQDFAPTTVETRLTPVRHLTSKSEYQALILLLGWRQVEAVPADETPRTWTYQIDRTTIGSSVDPVDAAVRLLHWHATNHPHLDQYDPAMPDQANGSETRTP